jgi:hypothetical protein
MDGKPNSGDEDRETAAADPPPDTEDGPSESFGVVDFTRRVKDDGRTLIVFTRPPGR